MGRMSATIEAELLLADEPEAFEQELARWLTPLRDLLGQLLAELGSPATPRVLQRQLDVGYAPCWRVFRIVQATDLTAEAQHAPAPGTLKRLLASAGRHGASARTVAAVRLASEQFRTFITRHAEDRSAFDSMVAGVTPKRADDTLILQRRRTAYRALSQLWGVQTDLHAVTTLIGPPSAVDPMNYVTLVQQRGIRRLRADAQVTLSGYRTSPDGLVGPEVQRVPLDPAAAAASGMPILPAFSSAPLPVVETVTTLPGWRLYNMVGGDIGLRSNIDCTLAVTSGKQTFEVDADGRELEHLSFTTQRKPVALLVLDLIVHRASHPGIRPGSLIHQYLEGLTSLEVGRRAQQFPGEDKVAFAGRADRLNLIESPAYGELLRHAAGAKGWALADFDAYRLRVPFPIFSTTARIYFHTHPLLGDPATAGPAVSRR